MRYQIIDQAGVTFYFRFMNTINQNSTGHSRSADISFSKKLFIGLGIAIVAAMIFFVLLGQRKDLSPTAPNQAPATSEAAKSAPAENTTASPTTQQQPGH